MTERPKSSPEPASGKEPIRDSIVFIIDDDLSMRRALTNLFESVGLEVEAFAAASELLKNKLPEVASCLVLDIRLPGLSGLDLQTELAKANIRIPIIFITGHGDIPMTVRAMKAGAIDFLAKPFDDERLLAAIGEAVQRDRERREALQEDEAVRLRYERLTPREREVMSLVAAGLMNKQIASRLALSEITVKIHRGNLMRKMLAPSLADLVRMAERLCVRASRATRRRPEAD